MRKNINKDEGSMKLERIEYGLLEIEDRCIDAARIYGKGGCTFKVGELFIEGEGELMDMVGILRERGYDIELRKGYIFRDQEVVIRFD